MIKPNIIAENGKSDYTIVCPKHPSECEHFAARELAKYIKLSTGAELPIISDEGATLGQKLIVGQNNSLYVDLEWPIRWDKLGKEGFWLQSVGSDIFLAGSAERGALYAVYEFLERCVGIRFFAPDETYIPQKPNLHVSNLDIKQIPYFINRNTSYTESFNPDYASKARINTTTTLSKAQGGYETFSSYRGHTFALIANPVELFTTHPEYFSMVDGQRLFERTQLCLTNPEVLELAVTKVREWMRAEPNNRIFSVSQNDWANPCECPMCEEINQAEGYSGTLLQFVNAVADALYEEFPQNLVETFAYQYTRTPPKTIKASKNVSIRLCTIECCFAHSLEECKETKYFNNKSLLDDLNGWSVLCQNMYIWDYTTNFWHYLAPFDNLFALKKNLSLYRDNNVKGLYMQGNSAGYGAFSELKAYLIPKLMWNPDQDDEKLINEFLVGYYGLAGVAIRRYIDLLHDLTKKTGAHFGLFEYPHREYFSHDFILSAERIFDEAEQLAPDEKTLSRVRRCRLQIDYLRLFRYLEDRAKNETRYKNFMEKIEKYGIEWLEEFAPIAQTLQGLIDGSFFDKQYDIMPTPGDYSGVANLP